MRSANIYDPIETDLDQRVFNGIDPRRSVIKFIQRVYYHALDRRLGVTGTEWADLYFTGSLTTYQYSETSDADVSVFPDYQRIWIHLNIEPNDARRMLIDMSINYLDGTFIPGTHHPLQFFVVPPGIMPQDLYKPGLRSAYDVLHGGWIVEPERSRSHNVQMEMPDLFARAADIAEKMSIMLDSGEYDSARELWHNIHAKRQLDQRAGLGDYSEGNIVYKWLLHEGLFDRIRNELGEFVAKVAVEWDNGELDPRLLDAERDVGGMAVWEKLEAQVERLAEQYKCSIWWLPRNMIWFAECQKNYALYGDNLTFKFEIKIPQITGEMSYYVALHEIGHAAFTLAHVNDILEVGSSQEEEAWATHFVLENSQIEFSRTTLEKMQENLASYENIVVKSPANPNWFTSAVDYNDGLGIRGPMDVAPTFQMPPEIENRFIEAMECPQCHGHLRREETGKIYCENCGWRPRQSGVDHLWDERVTTKIIYDFDKDRIILGTQADLPKLHQSNKIVGEYDDGKAILFEADKQWINPSYFRRLWHASYPERELKDVYFRRESGDEYKLKSLPRKRKKSAEDPFMTTQKFMNGDYVEFDGGSGVIVGVPYVTQEGTFYYVKAYDSEGPRGIEVWPENALHRPSNYDERGESTLQDWLGIPPEAEDYYRTAATETGDPVIDSLLNMFKQAKFQHVKGHISVEELRDPKIANGLCHTLAKSFANFMTKHGYEAWLPKYGTGTPEEFGYTDRAIEGHAGHYWTYIKSGDDTYGVDWTAAQYGYDELPVVQKLTESGWQRDDTNW